MSKLKKQNIGFTQVSNEVLYSNTLSAKAKVVYAYLYSKPDGWNFSSERIAKDFKESRKWIQTGIRELEENGYLLRQKLKNGRMEYQILANIDLKPKSAQSQIGTEPKATP